jgi:molybdate transport system regulatory protein
VSQADAADDDGRLSPGARRARQRRERAASRPWPGGARPRVRAGHRVFLHEQGAAMFGPGICDLLVLVRQTGSLHKAAQQMRMSYNKAWHVVRTAEEHLQLRLLSRRTGGAGGGGSSLTPEGAELVARFQAFMQEADADLDALYRKHFGDLPFARPELDAPGEPGGDEAAESSDNGE